MPFMQVYDTSVTMDNLCLQSHSEAYSVPTVLRSRDLSCNPLNCKLTARTMTDYLTVSSSYCNFFTSWYPGSELRDLNPIMGYKHPGIFPSERMNHLQQFHRSPGFRAL